MEQKENAYAVYGELIRYLANTRNELTLDMYASSMAHVEITPEKVTEEIDKIKRVLDIYRQRVNLEINQIDEI